MNGRLMLGVCAVAACAVDSALMTAAAQIDEIVVTARRRAESLQDVPVAITAFSDEDMAERNVRNVADVAAFTPNLVTTGGPTGGNDGFFFIRGIGQLDSNPAADPGVGVYLDEVYIGRIQGSSFDTLNIERVEVLRGPQGTLFGRNTIGGAINVVTADPGEELSGELRVIAGERERWDLYGQVGGPVSDKVGVQASAFYREQDGWARNPVTDAQYGDVKNWGGRIKTVLTPTDAVEVKLIADIARGDGTPAPTKPDAFNPFLPGTPLGVAFPDDLGDGLYEDRGLTNQSNEPIFELENQGLAGVLSWDLGGAAFKSITSYREVSQLVTNDFDGTGYAVYDNTFDTEQNQFSQELQLSGEGMDDRLTWLLGVYYFDENSNHNNQICQGTNDGVLNDGTTAVRYDGRCLENNQSFTLDVESIAGFGHLTYDLTDRFSVVAGLRYTDETKEQSYSFFVDNTAGVLSSLTTTIPTPGGPLTIPIFPQGAITPTFAPGSPALLPGTPTDYEDSWSEWTPKVGLNYEVSSEVLLYASYARGFKSGGFNGRPNPVVAGPNTGRFLPVQSYDPEVLDTYEIGFKSSLLDRRLVLNAAAFFSDYQDVQILTLDPNTAFFNTANAGEVDIFGFEVEAVAEPVEGLRFDLGVGYLDDEYTSVDPDADPDFPGAPEEAGIDLDDSLPVTPTWTVNVGGQYEVDLAEMGSVRLRADYAYRSEVFFQAENNAFDGQDGYGLLNVRGTYTFPNDRVAVSVYGINVTDEEFFTNRQDVLGPLGTATSQLSAPSEWGAELSLRF